jgi:hypothetical protein
LVSSVALCVANALRPGHELPQLAWAACAILAFIASLATAAALVIRPRSPIVLWSAALVALLTSMTADPHGWWEKWTGIPRDPADPGWDSAGLLYCVLATVAAVSGILVMVPRTMRRVAVSLLIIFHFGGILSAVTNAPPNVPWLSAQLWMYVYRPYLQFMYMNNAYHYYAPDPGPASLLWFCVEYEGQARHWVRVPWLDADREPRRTDGRLLWPKVEYTRRLSLAEAINQRTLPSLFDYQRRERNRLLAGQHQGIPALETVPLAQQFREPNTQSKLWLESYVRHVARTCKHPEHPELAVNGVKAYLVIHNMLTPGEFLAPDRDPNDLDLYTPYYYGEFDAKGVMKDTCLTVKQRPDGSIEELYRDPFLYWIIPIVRVPGAAAPAPRTGNFPPFPVIIGKDDRPRPEPAPEEGQLKDYLEIHAGAPAPRD